MQPDQQNPYQPSEQPNASPTPQPGQPTTYTPPQFDTAPTTGNSPRFPLGIIAAIIAGVVAIGVVGWLLFIQFGPKDNSSNSQSASTNQPATYDSIGTTQPLNGSTLKLSPTFSAAEAIKDQTLTAKANEQINASDGLSFAVTKVERSWAGTTSKPRAGKEFVAVTVQYGNRDEDQTKSVHDSTFKLIDSTNKEQSSSFVTPRTRDGNFPTDALPSGEQRTGIIVFEVAQGDTSLSLTYNESYVSSENGNVTIDAKISL